jgi:glycosyltransferase involved in cell wall biosynthesis
VTGPEPHVSVVMSVYNGERHLQEAIDSILKQTFTDFEFIIINDGSTDGTAGILSAAASADHRVRVMDNEKNIGLTRSLNRGVAAARGSLVARQDADDTSVPDRIATQVAYMSDHPEVGVLGSDLLMVDSAGKHTGSFGSMCDHAEIVWRMLYGRTLAHPSIMFRTSLVRASGGYSISAPVAQDFELWTRVVGQTRFANLRRPLVRYKSHANAISRTRAADQRQVVLAARQVLFSRLLCRGVTMEEVVAIERAANPGENISLHEWASSEPLLVELATAMESQGVFQEEDRELVREAIGARRAGIKSRTSEMKPLLRGKRLLKSALNSIQHKYASSPPADAPMGIVRSGASTPRGVSVVILSYGRTDGLRSLIRSLYSQISPELQIEVILCNNYAGRSIIRSFDWRLRKLIKGLPDVKLFDSDYNWACTVRYALATLAKYETILFIDDDIEIMRRGFILDMARQLDQLAPNDILSCWTTIWTDWQGDQLSTVSLTFKDGSIDRLTEVDTAGPGISMFRRDSIVSPDVLGAVMSPKFERADDMGFSLIMSLSRRSRKYFFPSHGALRFHEESTQTPLNARSNRYRDLFALYRHYLKNGYEPVLARQAREEPNKKTVQRELAETKPWQTFDW